MPRSNESWGIEVGANAIKAVHLIREGAAARLLEYEILPFKKVLSTPDLNVEEAIQLNLDQFLSKHDVGRSTVVISVPGHMAFARFAKLPPVEPKKIPDIVKFEAVQQIPFPIDQVEWDYQVFSQADSPDVEVGIFAITKDRVMQFLSNYRSVGLPVHGLTLSPLALYNAMAYDQEINADTPGTIYMDIGTTATDVIIVEGGHVWLRTLPIGGNNFTEALVRAFKLSFPKAEKLKREAGTSKYARQIFQAMRPVFADLVQEMQRSTGYYKSINRDAQLNRLVGFGSTFRLPGLQKFLKQQLQIDVIRPDGFKRLTVEGKQESEFAEDTLNLATAYGLALQGVGLERVSANILPRHIIKQRIWRAKQPWFGAAAALMLVASGAAMGRLWTEQGQYQSLAKETDSQVNPVIGQTNSLVQQWKSIEGGTDPRQRIENLRRILDYRDIWPKLLVDLDRASKELNSQPALLTSDYNEIKKIPRPERRRIYLETLTAEYVVTSGAPAANTDPNMMGGPHMGPGGPAGQSSAGPAPASLTADEIWGERQAGQEAAATGKTPPSFVITMRGYTPYAEGARFISDNFIKWLQDKSKHAKRPYTIIATRQSLVSIERRGGGGASPARPTIEPVRPQPTRGRRVAPAPGMEMEDPMMMGGPATPAVSTGNLPDLLPARPLADEPKDRDWQFVIQWTIRLVRPEDARQAEDAPQAAGAKPAPSQSDAAKPASHQAAADRRRMEDRS